MAAAPSLTPEALPAVTVPGAHDRLQLWRGLPTWSRGAGARPCRPRPPGLCRRAPRPRRSPREIAGCDRRPARCCERIANDPGRRRDTWNSSATFCRSRASRRRRMRLHQRVDEAPADGGVIGCRRSGNASAALPITNGARVIDSTPPAMAKSISPARIARAPCADRVEPRGAKAVEGLAGNRLRHAGQQQRQCARIAVVLAGLWRSRRTLRRHQTSRDRDAWPSAP